MQHSAEQELQNNLLNYNSNSANILIDSNLAIKDVNNPLSPNRDNPLNNSSNKKLIANNKSS